MSVESLMEYARRCASDPELRVKAKEIGASNVAGQIAFSKTMGLEWGFEDLAEYMKEVQADDELSVEDLEKVAGGLATVTAAAATAAVAIVTSSAVVAGTAVASSTSGSGW